MLPWLNSNLATWAGAVVTTALWLGIMTGLVLRAIEGRDRGQ